MGASPDTPSSVNPAFADVLRAAADADGALSFDRFMALALYHPELGYYRRNRVRVGYGQGTDFFTASTSGPIFGELVVAAAAALLPGEDLRTYTWIEIGAEQPGGILTGVSHSFGATRTLRVGDPLQIKGKAVVFSNELFDAQPFRRLIRRPGAWHELGVRLAEGALHEVDLGPARPGPWPESAPDDYRLDAPVAAGELATALAQQPWDGLFLAFDYGKSWAELTTEHPAGTARAYVRHTQSNDLLAQPGEQDLTCHVCWDWIAAALAESGFAAPTVEAQEAFFVRHAAAYLQAALQADATRLTERKRSLMQLLHPAHLGRKFQVLHARRKTRQDSP